MLAPSYQLKKAKRAKEVDLMLVESYGAHFYLHFKNNQAIHIFRAHKDMCKWNNLCKIMIIHALQNEKKNRLKLHKMCIDY